MERLDWRWLGVTWMGSSVRSWILAVGVSAVAFLVLILTKRLIIRRLGATAERTPTEIDDVILEMTRRTRRGLLLFPVLFFGSLFLSLPHRVGAVLRIAAVLAILLQLALWSLLGIDTWVASTRRKRLAADAASATLIGALGFLGKLVLLALLVLVALANLGVNVTALVAGLGIGGVAVALALQNILGDLLASLSIVLDKPFVLGDTIQVDDFVGTVENIGLKTTHLRSLSGEQIVFPNGNLVQSRIRNHKRMAERRVVFSFGVVYDTPVATLEKIPGIVKEIVAAQDQVRFDRAHFKRLGDSSLEFEVVFTVLTPDYNLYLDRQQAMNLALLRRFQDEGIALAYPTRTIRLEGLPRAPDKETPCVDGS
jgi:small-conductance mechanosensitive channel